MGCSESLRSSAGRFCSATSREAKRQPPSCDHHQPKVAARSSSGGFAPSDGSNVEYRTRSARSEALRLAALAEGTIRLADSVRDEWPQAMSEPTAGGRVEWCGRGDLNSHGVAPTGS